MDVSLLRALAVAANMANHAAAFVLDNTAAVRTSALEENAFCVLHLPAVSRHVSLNRFGYRIGAGQNFVFTEAGR